jgi:ATP-dependent helicase/nuclease subunit A
LSFVSALPNGQGRRTNLLKLHDRAIQFEGFASSAGVASLTRFVEFIEKLQQAGGDWASAEPEAVVGNAVRIMSVHKSKGLEFPVVFLAELNSRFNKADSQGDFLVETNDTLGLQIIDRQANSKLSSLAHQVIAERKLSRSLAEEMRILYVATTRARERLILTASEKSKRCYDVICNGFFSGEKSISDWQLRSCQSPFEWILYGLCDQKNLHTAFETGLAEKCVDDDLFSIKLYGQRELEQLSNCIHKLKTSKRQKVKGKKQKVKNNNQLSIINNQLKRSLAWRYRFGDVPLLPAKRSVTQLTHRNDEYANIEYRISNNECRSVDNSEFKIQKLSLQGQGQLIGATTHLVIAQLDLTGPVTKKVIEKTKGELLADNAVTEAAAERIDIKSITAFFESELGRTVLDASNTVWREWPFTFAIPASEWEDSDVLRDTRYEIQDTIIVQGIIDMLVQTPRGLLIVDFKTDHITAEQVPERAEVYREQLELYGRAAAAILKDELLGKWLYFLTSNIAYSV